MNGLITRRTNNNNTYRINEKIRIKYKQHLSDDRALKQVVYVKQLFIKKFNLPDDRNVSKRKT